MYVTPSTKLSPAPPFILDIARVVARKKQKARTETDPKTAAGLREAAMMLTADLRRWFGKRKAGAS